MLLVLGTIAKLQSKAWPTARAGGRACLGSGAARQCARAASLADKTGRERTLRRREGARRAGEGPTNWRVPLAIPEVDATRCAVCCVQLVVLVVVWGGSGSAQTQQCWYRAGPGFAGEWLIPRPAGASRYRAGYSDGSDGGRLRSRTSTSMLGDASKRYFGEWRGKWAR